MGDSLAHASKEPAWHCLHCENICYERNIFSAKKKYAENICSEKNMTDVFTKQLLKSGPATGHISISLESAKPSPVFRVGVRQGYGLV